MVQDEMPLRKTFPHEAESYSSLKLAAKYLRLKIGKHDSLICNTAEQEDLQQKPREKNSQHRAGSLLHRADSSDVSRTPRLSTLSPPPLSSCGSIETMDISSPEQSIPTPFLRIAETESTSQEHCEGDILRGHESVVEGLIDEMRKASSVNNCKLKGNSLTYVQAQGQRNWRYDSNMASDLFVQANLIPC